MCLFMYWQSAGRWFFLASFPTVNWCKIFQTLEFMCTHKPWFRRKIRKNRIWSRFFALEMLAWGVNTWTLSILSLCRLVTRKSVASSQSTVPLFMIFHAGTLNIWYLTPCRVKSFMIIIFGLSTCWRDFWGDDFFPGKTSQNHWLEKSAKNDNKTSSMRLHAKLPEQGRRTMGKILPCRLGDWLEKRQCQHKYLYKK